MPSNQEAGLEIPDDRQFQKNEWRIQHIAWVFLGGLLIAIMFGLLGKGPLSHREVGAANAPLVMTYERFLRHRSPDSLHLSVRPAADTVQVMLSNDYTRDMEITGIVPTPIQVIGEAGYQTYVFRAGTSQPMEVTFYIEPDDIGQVGGWIALGGGPRQSFSQFVYP